MVCNGFHCTEQLLFKVTVHISAPWSSSAAISGGRVREQCACAMERCQRGEGLPSSLGSNYRSGRSHIWQHLVYLPLSHVLAHTFINSLFVIHKGRNVETVELAGESEFYALSGLQPDTEYIVTIISLYEGNAEGSVATTRFKIGRFFSIAHPNIPNCYTHQSN